MNSGAHWQLPKSNGEVDCLWRDTNLACFIETHKKVQECPINVLRQRGWVSQMSANDVRTFLAGDKSLSPSLTHSQLWSHPFSWSDSIYLFHIAYFTVWLTIMGSPPFPYKLTIPILHITCLLIPSTSQFSAVLATCHTHLCLHSTHPASLQPHGAPLSLEVFTVLH